MSGTLATDNLGATMEVIELIILNVQGEGAEATLVKSGVLRSNVGSGSRKIGSMGEV